MELLNNSEYAKLLSQLTPKQKLFYEHYLETENGLESARIAGYGDNYKSLGVQGSKLLKSPKIARLLEIRKEQQRKLDAVTVLTKDETLSLLSNLAKGTDPNGKEVPPVVQQKALDSLLKYHGVTEKIEISGNIDIATVLNNARNRLERLNTIENEVPQEALLTN